MWADAGRDRDHAGLPGDVDCRSLGFLPACRAQAQALLLIIRVLFIIRPGAAGAPLLTCAHGYATDIQESLEMLQVSPSILDRGSCLSVSSSSIDLGLGLGSLHTGYTYHLHSWKSAKPAPRA